MAIVENLRRAMFKHLVVNTLLSGLECETLRKCDYDKLETCQTMLAGKALGNKGAIEKKDKMHQKDNNTVRELMHIGTIYSELRIRRIELMEAILTQPDQTEQLRAAVGGKTKIGDGTIKHEYEPWLKQLAEDVIRFGRIARDRALFWERKVQIEEHLCEVQRWMEDKQLVQLLIPEKMNWWKYKGIFVEDYRDQSECTKYENANERRHVEAVCHTIDTEGQLCTCSGTATEVGMHKHRIDGMKNSINAIALTNECPNCDNKFKTIRYAREHANNNNRAQSILTESERGDKGPR